MRSHKWSKPIIRTPRKLLYIPLSLVFLAGVYELQGLSASESTVREKTPQELMSVLVNKLSKRQLSRIELYYFDWGADVYSGLTQEDLLRQYQYKVVIANPLWNTDDLQYALSQFKFRKVEEAAFTFRIACIFDMGKEGTIGLFFAGNAPVVSIGQTFFKAESDLLSTVAEFIPHQEYERMCKSVLSQWTDSSRSMLPQKAKQVESEVTR